MTIRTQQDWIDLAGTTIPLLPDYMIIHRPNWSAQKIEEELSTLYEAKNWEQLHFRLEQLWASLPDSPSIRHRPFFDLCDLCSEYWVFHDGGDGEDPLDPDESV